MHSLPHVRAAWPYALLTLASFFWACSWIVGRGLADDIPPMGLTFFRWLFAALMLAPFAWREVVRQRQTIRANWKVLLLLGGIGIGAHNALAYLGLNFTTATNGVILNSFVPVMIAATSWAMFGERLSHSQVAGIGISLAGVLTILSHGSIAALVSVRLNPGDLLVVLAMMMWAVYTVCLRWTPRDLHALTLLFVLACIGSACVLPFFVGEALLGRQMLPSLVNLAALLAVALFSSVLAYVFWNRGVELVGANVAGLFVHLMPVFGVLLARAVLDEPMLPFHVVGIGLILAGIWLTSRRARGRVAATAGSG